MPQPTEESYDALLAERMRMAQELEEERATVTALEHERDEYRTALQETLDAVREAKSEREELRERSESLELTLSTMMEVLGWERAYGAWSCNAWSCKIPGEEKTFYTTTPVDAARMAGDLIHDQRKQLSFFAEKVETQSSQLESYAAQVNRLTRERDKALAEIEARA